MKLQKICIYNMHKIIGIPLYTHMCRPYPTKPSVQPLHTSNSLLSKQHKTNF